jgi:hypothetical protein
MNGRTPKDKLFLSMKMEKEKDPTVILLGLFQLKVKLE